MSPPTVRSAGSVIATVTVFAWSVVMVAAGQVAAIATLAPALGLAVQQIVQTVRPQNARASGHRVEAIPDEAKNSAR